MVLDIEYTLVLQSIVIEVINLIFYIERCSHLGIVGKLGQAGPNLVAERDFAEIGLSDVVLGFYPLCCLGAVVIFEPTVRVGDLCTEVVVDNIYCFSLRIIDFLLGSSAAGN